MSLFKELTQDKIPSVPPVSDTGLQAYLEGLNLYLTKLIEKFAGLDVSPQFVVPAMWTAGDANWVEKYNGNDCGVSWNFNFAPDLSEAGISSEFLVSVPGIYVIEAHYSMIGTSGITASFDSIVAAHNSTTVTYPFGAGVSAVAGFETYVGGSPTKIARSPQFSLSFATSNNPVSVRISHNIVVAPTSSTAWLSLWAHYLRKVG